MTEELAQPTPDQQNEDYAFVLNIARLTGGEPFTLAAGHTLRRATDLEIVEIKKNLEFLLTTPGYHNTFWERRLPHHGPVEIAPSAEWRYFVIAFTGNNAVVNEITDASHIAPVELEVGFTVTHDGPDGERATGVIWHGDRLFHVLEAAWYQDDFFVDFSSNDAEGLRDIHGKIVEHNGQIIDARRLCRQMGELKAFPHGSPLRFLGYFGILESLLTHVPRPSDPYDSITRQVKKKLALLNNRWSIKLDYAPFRGAAPDTVWSKMYGYRSLLAHGGAPNFGGELALLVDPKTALKLVKETVKTIIRHALTEPQLIVDLRDC